MIGGGQESDGSITVTQLNDMTKGALESSPDLQDLWVSGEVSNLNKNCSGHYYFVLKDESSEIKCTLFKYARSKIAIKIDDNMKVLVRGSVTLYVPRGSVQLNVIDIKAQGVGELYLAYEALKSKLEKEGLFDESRKRKIPHYPKRIGVVTSPTGAAIRDILNITARRFPADILLVPAQVQGEKAAQSIIKGIELLNEASVDVIIVGRGGGSIEDLWAFNEEAVARAIYASKVPIVSAVGHETDYTISDLVADLRAPTPSAAAELVLPDRDGESKTLDSIIAMARNALNGKVERMRSRLEVADRTLAPRRMLNAINQRGQRLDELNSRLKGSMERTLESKRYVIESFQASLIGLDPRKVLERGYCIVRSADGGTVTSVNMVSTGEQITIVVKDGALISNIIRKVNSHDGTT